MPKTEFNNSANERQRSFGIRRRYRGKMVQRTGEPRANRVDRTPANISYTCGDTAIPALPTRDSRLGPYRVAMPHGRIKYVRSA
jgi:hypothetical protein